MMGDALAMAVMQARGFNEEDFARSHPAGALGARLLNKVHHLMRTDDAIPQVKLDTSVMDAMLELSRTGLGLVAVCDNDRRGEGRLHRRRPCAAGWWAAASWRRGYPKQ